MQNTPLHKKHEALGAKMVPFAGYNMPIQYSGVNQEHIQVRNAVGVFDVSHMGEFLISGKGATELLQKISSNDVGKLVDGQAQYTCMPNSTGGIVDDMIIYRYNAEKYLVVVNASNIEKDWNWMVKHNSFGAEMTDLSKEYALLAVQGPKAVESLQSLCKIDLNSIKYYHFTETTFAGVPKVIVSATGYTGSGGFELYVPSNDAEKVWDAVFEAGKENNIMPIGLAARDTLRLEMGFCLYGNDIDDTTSPLEAGLGWITKFTHDFVNCDNLLKQKEEGIKNRLVAFEMIDRGIPRKDYEIADKDGNIIGRVTSGTQSPCLNKAIGLGYVKKAFMSADTPLYIVIRNKHIAAKVVKLPFYKA